MADPVTAIVGSTVASIGGSLIGGSQASKAAGRAADTQAEAARYAAELERQQFERQVELQEPFRQAGLTAQNQLLISLGLAPQLESRDVIRARIKGAQPGLTSEQYTELTSKERNAQLARINQMREDPNFGRYARDFSMQDFEADPGYAFRMSEGMKGLERSAAARGGLLSGATMKGIQRFGQDLGSQEYMNAFNRYQTNRANQLNPLQSLTGAGQTSANTLGTAAQQYGRGASEAAYGGANARASGYVGSANAWNQALGGATNAIGQGIGMYNFMNRPTAPTAASYGFSSVPGTTGVNAFL